MTPTKTRSRDLSGRGFQKTGTGREARTPDTRFWRPMLYQLSYSRVCGCKSSTFSQICKPLPQLFLPFQTTTTLHH